MLLKTLGGLALEGTTFQRPKLLLLLSYLALEGAKDRRFLSELFWPSAVEPMTSLRMALSQVRKDIPGVLEMQKEMVSVKLEVDAVTLLKALERGEAEALSLYRGPFLFGFYLPDLGAELEEWTYATREFLAERVREVLLQQAETEAARGDFKAAAKHAEEAYTLAAAPTPEPDMLERLYPLLLAGDSLFADKLRNEAREYDLSLRLSRDEARARFLAQQGGKKHQASQLTLPQRTTSFIGRDPELLQLAELLADPTLRLLTLTGAGGVGKTRLALQAAYEQVQTGNFADGVYLVPLETVSEASVIPAAIAKSLALQLPERDEPLGELCHALNNQHTLLVLDNFEQLIAGAAIVSRLLEGCPKLKLLVTSRERLHLAEEQIFPLTGLSLPRAINGEALNQDAVKLFVQRAKRACPDFAPEEHLSDIVALCQRLEGVPLAIELAATWVRLMSPGDIVKELGNPDFLETPLRNVSDRHRSLRATFEYSWNLLNAKEQSVLRQLSVFAGSFSRAAASEVAGASISLLASLVDKSLLRVLPSFRYERHPLLSQYSQEKLSEVPSEKVLAEARHAAYYLALAEAAEQELKGTRQASWFERLESEHDNLRAVLSRCLAREGDARVGLELMGRLWQFWEGRAHLREGRYWLKEMLGRTHERTALRAKALNGAGMLAFDQGDYGEARTLLEEGLAIRRELGLHRAAAMSLNNLGLLAVRRSDQDLAAARAHYEESLAVLQTLGERQRTAIPLSNLGNLLRETGDYATARAYHEQSLAIEQEGGGPQGIAQSLLDLGLLDLEQDQHGAARERLEESLRLFEGVGDRYGVGLTLSYLGLLALKEGDCELAEARYRASLILRRELGDKKGVAECLTGLAGVAIKQQSFKEAAHLLAAVEVLLETIGGRLDLAERTLYEQSLSTVQTALGEHSFMVAWAEGHSLPLENMITLALATPRHKSGV